MAERIIKIAELPPPFQIKETRAEGVQRYGKDNAYPTRIERLIDRSVTARSCSLMLSRFLVGQGFENETLNDIVVGQDKLYREIKAIDILRGIAASIARFHGVYVRVQYNGELKISGLRIEDFKNCRFGKLDDQAYAGKIIIYDNWDKQKSQRYSKDKWLIVDAFNPRKSVIKAQIKRTEGGMRKYKGQIYFNFYDDSYLYPVSLIDPVQYEADTERQIQMFKNGELRRGFFLKHVIHHTDFATENEAEKFTSKILEFIGGGHEKAAMIVPGTFDDKGNFLENENIKIDKVDQNVDADIFGAYEGSTANAIRKAFYAIPQILIEYEDSKLGTTSGEALRQAAEFYNAMTTDLRANISGMFDNIFRNWHDPSYSGADFKIKELTFGSNQPEDASLDSAFAKLFARWSAIFRK